jgi:hypothetical protein
VRLALADAFHLGRVQAVDFGAALSALLREHTPRQARHQPRRQRRLVRAVLVDRAAMETIFALIGGVAVLDVHDTKVEIYKTDGSKRGIAALEKRQKRPDSSAQSA